MTRTLLALASVLTAHVSFGQLQIGGTHPFPFEAPSSRGTDTVFTTGVISATIANEVVYYDTPGGGNLLGNSEYPVNTFAQQFSLAGQATVDEILFLFAEKAFTSGNSSSRITAHVYNMNGTTGTTSTVTATAPCPGAALANADVAVSNVTTTGFTSAHIGPVLVNSNFAAGFDIVGLASGDSVNLAATTDGYVQTQDASWLRLNSSWATCLALLSSGGNIDLGIGVVLTPEAVGVGEQAWFNGMQMSFMSAVPAHDQVQLSYALDHAANMGLRMIDGSGRTVLQENLGTKGSGTYLHTLDLSGAAAGTYYVILSANGRTITKKLAVH